MTNPNFVNVEELVDKVVVNYLVDTLDITLEEDVDIALDDFLADVEELGEPVVDGLWHIFLKMKFISIFLTN